MSRQSGYYRFPTLQGDRVVFVCEDDLWSVPASGGVALRLTSNLGEVTHPFLSPDGSQLAFVGREEGNPDIYVMPGDGGTARRLTFLGGNSHVVGWSADGQFILFASTAGQPFRRLYNLYRISPDGGQPERLPLGLANHISYGPDGRAVLGRNTSDTARWKRYRGGTAGVLWVDPNGTGEFQRLIDLRGNLTSPLWVGDRTYFISDHEGVGNLYSCTPQGEDLQAHTHNCEYYVRNATTDGKRIVFQSGAELFIFDPASGEAQPIAIDFHSPQVQRQRKFVEAGKYLEDYTLHPEGHTTLITCRGKSFWFGNWEGAVTQLGEPDGVRYRLTRWLNDQKRLVTISDASGVEAIEIHTPHDLDAVPERLEGLDLGRAIGLAVSPTANQVALTNHRHELILVNLDTKQSQVLDRSEYARIHGFSWSPDGQWIAYAASEQRSTSSIKLCRVETGELHRITPPRFVDFCPSFDPEGKFLYFLSYREFNPVYDSLYFDLGFPRAVRPYLVSLKRDTASPFVPVPKPLKPGDKPQETPEPGAEGTGRSRGSALPTVEIDLEGIDRRIVAFPVPEARYREIAGAKGKVLFRSIPIKGSLDDDDDWAIDEESIPESKLEVYDFEKQQCEVVASKVSSFRVGYDKETLIYRSGNKLRVCAIAPQNGNGKSKADEEPGRKSGWLDLKRVKVSVVPTQEWQQMFREVWRLQQQHFWVEDMSGVDWERVFKRYRPLLDKVSSRSEFSDLVWELQGELGTSHAYEMGGDYRKQPQYQLGFLGADFAYDEASNAYRVTHIVRGDSWQERADSALNRLGCNIQEGDLLLAVGGRRVSRELPPQALLVHQSHSEVALTFASDNGPRTVTVKTLTHEAPARYREWVERNHQKVQEATNGRIGYVHVPDMGPLGYAEFHRYYGVEAAKEGLIVDVRYNGGGHVSQLLLEKLARERIGYDVSRWGKPDPYPSDSVPGPIVAITNEQAGSDGDIFSHCFKLMKLGTLIGKRTWGGVIGIWPRHALVDGSIITQPEFSFWFKDVGWGVENYGTDPDIEVEITPQEWGRGDDPQLDKAIKLILEQLEQEPVKLPEFGDRPVLKLPE